MRSLFPNSQNSVEKIRLQNDVTIDVYVWRSPEGIKIATHMIMGCPECKYPLSMASSEYDFDEDTLGHQLDCPARWKKTSSVNVNDRIVQVVELNKGKPVIQRCGWRGYILEGVVVTKGD